MGLAGLDWQLLQLPIAVGLNQKADPRALPMPSLVRGVDIEFREVGGVQTRKPFSLALGLAIADSANVLEPTDFRRLAVNGDELLLWTRNALWAWSEQKAAWVHKGEHLAVAVDEKTVLATSADQIDGDRVELGGYTAYTWYEQGGGTFVAVVDSATGTVTYGPHAVTFSTTSSRPRLVALVDRVLLFFHEDLGTDGLYVYSFDPADPNAAFSGASTTVFNTVNQHIYYDVVAVPGADKAIVVHRRTPTTSYSVFEVTDTPTVTGVVKARACDGPISIAVTPDGDYVQVVRASGTNIVGDLLDAATLADVYSNQAIGTADDTPVNQIGVEYFDALVSGTWRAQVYWSAKEAVAPAGFGAAPFELRTNWVGADNTIGAPVTNGRIAFMVGVASRPFAHDGHVYVWVAFAGQSTMAGANAPGFRAQLQNTYFLYREDGVFVAKATSMQAGGYAPSIGRLPAVTKRGFNSFLFMGGVRRIVATTSSGKQRGYESRACREVGITFDSDAARRSARLGQTLYVAGGEVLQYDGQGLTEVGFHTYPWFFLADPEPGGALADGDYAYKLGWRWLNARGEAERSTSATVVVITINSTDRQVSLFGGMPLVATHKTGARSNVVAEFWRTAKDPNDDDDFFLVSSQDPGASVNPNRFALSRPDVAPIDEVEDGLVDADLKVRPLHPETAISLENLVPPPATIVLASADRLFLAGVAGDPSRVWYSKQRGDGEVAAFHDTLTASIPATAGAITAIGFLNETLVAFTAGAVYALPGDGIDNVGGGQNFGPARLLASDVGALSQETVALTPEGLVFKSAKGWYLLGRGWDVRYIGDKVSDYDGETVLAVHVLPAQHQLRVLTPFRMLVLDTHVGEWAEWTVSGALDAAIWKGKHIVLDSTLGVLVQRDDYTGVAYGLDIELLVKFNELQGFARCRRLLVLGEHRSAHKVRLRIGRDYDTNYLEDLLWLSTPAVVGGTLQLQHGPKEQQLQAMRVRITAARIDSATGGPVYPPDGESLKLTGLALEVGLKRGGYPRLPAAQRK